MNFARYSGLRLSGAATVTPTLAKRSLTSGVSTASLAATASRRTIVSGVPLGNTIRQKEKPHPSKEPYAELGCALRTVRAQISLLDLPGRKRMAAAGARGYLEVN
jgi:hypothetical protein